MSTAPISADASAVPSSGPHTESPWVDAFDSLESALAACGAGALLAAELQDAEHLCLAAVATIADDLVLALPEPASILAQPHDALLAADSDAVFVSDFSITLGPAEVAIEATITSEAVLSALEVAVAQQHVHFGGASASGLTLSAGQPDDDDDDIPTLPRLTLRRLALAMGTVLGLGAVTAVAIAPATDITPPSIRLVVEQVSLSAPSAVADDPALPLPRVSQSEVVNRGETASSLLSRLGANDPELIKFIGSDRIGKRLLQLQPGRTVTAEIDDVGVVHRLQYRHGNIEIDGRPPMRVTIVREGGRLVATEQAVAVDRGIEARAAEVQSTLFAATDAAGIPDSVATRAADILSNSIDLRKDLRRGARLRVVYETLREADSLDLPVPGRVLAIEIESGNIRHEAVWFEHDDGRGAFYNFAGQSLVRSFLREPIQYTRITSGFSGARLHPLFQDVRAHTGTDFAAPVGTRVRSVADGVVDFAGYNGGYGRTVIVSHPGKITTLYAHLNAFGEGVTKGARVTQGQVIGTVGMTGWTTGPHLHYEFRVGGRHVDPMRAVLPEGRKLSMSERLRFTPLADTYREHMAQIGSASTTAQAKFE